MQQEPHTSLDHPLWDKLALLAVNWPFIAGLGAGVGYLGHQLLKEETDALTRRQLIGGVLLATFTGSVGYFLLTGLSFPDKLAIPLALLFGSSGEVGYQLLINRAKQLLNPPKKEG